MVLSNSQNIINCEFTGCYKSGIEFLHIGVVERIAFTSFLHGRVIQQLTHTVLDFSLKLLRTHGTGCIEQNLCFNALVRMIGEIGIERLALAL